jgi:3-oxoacyl-[acyl-carrier protein] reductase
MSKSDKKRLGGKVAIITGAGQGIGEAIALLFAEQGARVIVNARTETKVNGVVDSIMRDGGDAHGVVADIGTFAGTEQLVSGALNRFKSIDILVHNAGIFPYNLLEEMDDDSWSKVLNVNLTSAYRLTKGCIPAMKRRGAGRVIFTSSVQGNHVAVPGCAHYAASKAGLTGLIRAAAMELAQYRITVNGVEPGLVITAGVENSLSERRRDLMAKYVPLKRWGEPVEIAHAMLYLASDEAAYVTGQSIVVDGGALLPQNGSFMV